VKGSVYQQCFCRDPATKRRLGRQCPSLKKKGHAGWYFKYDAPAGLGEKRRQPETGPFPTKGAAEEELAATLARTGGGAAVTDRGLLVRDYLATWLAARRHRLKPGTWNSYEEAVRLYFAPGLGHHRLVDLRDRHLQELVTAMTQINQPVAAGEKPSETLRRLIAARADDVRKELPAGEKRRKKSTKPLSAARIEREFAVIRAALNDAVPGKIMVSPFDGVVLPRVVAARPLPWTPQREERFRAELGKRVRNAEAAAEQARRVLTTVERQELWAAADLRPAPAMVWMPAHAGQFLDYLDETGERLGPLFVVAMFAGLRRDEALGLSWADVDLEHGVLLVRETASGSGPKSSANAEAGIRPVPLSPSAVSALKAWRKIQAADRLAWGPDWQDTGRVFTREDGGDVPAQWTSVRFEILAYRSGMPPVRFHDLRHGYASLMKAAGVDTKIISAGLGHSRTSFTDSQYVSLFPEVQAAAAAAADAIVPRRKREGLNGV
jgi:integrase